MPFYATNPQQYWMPKQRFDRSGEEPIYPPKPPEGPISARAAKPLPIPEGKDLEWAEKFDPTPVEEPGWQTDATKRLARLGATLGDVDRVNQGWGSGYVAAGQVGDAAPVSSTTRFGTATFAPGTFMIGAADPRQREFLTQRDVAQSARSQRELSDFLTVNAPTGTRDNYGTTDPMMDSRIRAGRAEAAAKANALNPLPGISVDDPMEVERAGGQAAYNAQKLAEARYAAATSPVGREATDQDTRARMLVGAAPNAMSIDAGADARDAFLRLLFPTLQKQGATPQDIAQIAALAKVSPEEVQKILAETGVR